MSSEALTSDKSSDATGAPSAVAAWLASFWKFVEGRLDTIGDYLNPILVKETRQALKSRQFIVTFVLLLACCWIVTMGGVAMIGPSIYYSAYGPTMLLAYYAILAFPLIVVVPYSAFRSLAAEREDNTYELLSITTLTPRQIISGKLGSALVQMAVYFSAITPCLAFTYLLRGIDMPTIVMILAYTFLSSLSLSIIGLLVATLSTQRYSQVIFSAAYVAILLVAFFFAFIFATAIVQSGDAISNWDEFWHINGFLATVFVTTFALAYFAAAARITFASANRSTAIRVAMLVQQAALIAWMDFGFQFWSVTNAVYTPGVLAFLYWLVLGALLVSEMPVMSARVKRSLPQSTIARIFLTWLNPGPVTGYFFVIANVTALLLIGCIVCAWGSLGATTFAFLGAAWGYLVAYLGLSRLIITGLRRFTSVSLLAGFLITFLLILIGSGIPYLVQMTSVRLRYEEYTSLQFSNPFWSLNYLMDNGTGTPEAVMLVMVVPAAAICLLLLNFSAAAREIREVRIAPPKRVLEDEAELHPAPPPLPKSPWDEPTEITPT